MGLLKRVKKYLAEHDNTLVARSYGSARQVRRNIRERRRLAKITGGKGIFITSDELIEWTEEWIRTFPSTYDVIVGIPRTGVLVAALIALKLGKPLSTPELVVEGRSLDPHMRLPIDGSLKLLLVDDSVGSGATMSKTAAFLASSNRRFSVTTASVTIHRDARNSVELFYKIVPKPQINEWELTDQKKVRVLASDVEGVLCEHRPASSFGNDEQYAQWAKKAKPYRIPTFTIDWLISERPERLREATEAWLQRFGVRYENLLMAGGSNPDVSGGGGGVRRKAEMLSRVKPEMFFSGNHREAAEIWKATKIATVCFDDMTFFTSS